MEFYFLDHGLVPAALMLSSSDESALEPTKAFSDTCESQSLAHPHRSWAYPNPFQASGAAREARKLRESLGWRPPPAGSRAFVKEAESAAKTPRPATSPARVRRNGTPSSRSSCSC